MARCCLEHSVCTAGTIHVFVCVLLQRTFEVAQRLPVHPTRKDLHPVEVLPLLPDFKHWADKFLVAQFDDDPQHESTLLSNISDPAVRSDLAGRCMLKTYKPNEEDHGSTAMALLVPQQVRLADLLRGLWGTGHGATVCTCNHHAACSCP